MWIAVVLRSLKYLKHPEANALNLSISCELLLYWDLWNIWNTKKKRWFSLSNVVNCCCIEIFEIFETPRSSRLRAQLLLWIAVVLRSLKYLKHQKEKMIQFIKCCELLLYWDLWNIWNTSFDRWAVKWSVVNCCCIEIFEIFETPKVVAKKDKPALWIAVVLRSLKYLKHPTFSYYVCPIGCELLLYWDLWNIWNTEKRRV